MSNYLVITGGSRGIGEKTIALFSREGCKIINISRTNCKLPNVTNLNIDLAQMPWTDEAIQSILAPLKDAKKICLVHNAASFMQDSVNTLTPASFKPVLDVNVVAPAYLNALILPLMQAGSSIIYIGSTLSEQAVPNRASYVISKHATIGLMRATCQDLAGKQITTCCICPGFVNTEMLTQGNDMQKLNAFIKQKVTAQRLIEPEEIADLIHYAATHPLLNGEVIHANLGQVMS